MKIELQKKSIPDEEQAYDVDDLTSQTIKLKDGRNLGYAEYGNFHGEVVLYFHGSPSSRLEAAALNETAMHSNVRIISIDRPGMGLSTFQNGRRILNFADDIAELVDVLNIDHFAVIGMSGGGPYVAACTYKFPQRITSASIISGIGPIDEPGLTRNMIFSSRFALWLSPRAPWLMKVLFTMIVGRLRRKRDLFFWKSVPQPDQATLSLPFISDTWTESISEAFRFGTMGPVLDLALYEQPWGFSPEDINFPIRIWHGELDRNVPSAIARRLAHRIPDCQAKFFPHEGHFSLWANHIEEIIENLIIKPYPDRIKQINTRKSIASGKKNVTVSSPVGQSQV